MAPHRADHHDDATVGKFVASLKALSPGEERGLVHMDGQLNMPGDLAMAKSGDAFIALSASVNLRQRQINSDRCDVDITPKAARGTCFASPGRSAGASWCSAGFGRSPIGQWWTGWYPSGQPVQPGTTRPAIVP